ncbi:DUF7006 family protein [Enterococcus mundtii]|uniref:DUF7006 family protein n=1 Tax=Enterococcus mundtii TaxID=53346 RepID=UPI00387C7B0F
MFKTKNEYVDYFKNFIEMQGIVGKDLEKYVQKQFRLLDQLISGISEETFWQMFPEILGIDAKLNLIAELIRWQDFSADDIIRIVENDYVYYFKELCGYDLNNKINHSMIFNIL